MEAAINPLLAELSSLVADPVERPEEKKRIIQRAVDTAGQLTGRTALSCLYWLDETSETLQRYAFNEAARGMPAEFTTDPAQKGSFLIGIARAPVGRHVKKISSDLDRQRIYMHDGCEAAYFVPVCVGLALKGLLVIQAKKAGSISRTESANKRIETLLNFVMAVKLEKSPQGHIPGQPVGPPPVPDGEVSVPPVG